MKSRRDRNNIPKITPKSGLVNNFVEDIKLYNKKDHERSVHDYKMMMTDLKNRNLELNVQNDTLMSLNKDLKQQLMDKNKDFINLEDRLKYYQSQSGFNKSENLEKDYNLMKKKQEAHIDKLENEIINKASQVHTQKTQLDK